MLTEQPAAMAMVAEADSISSKIDLIYLRAMNMQSLAFELYDAVKLRVDGAAREKVIEKAERLLGLKFES